MAYAFEFGTVRPLWSRQGHCTGYTRCVARQDLLSDVLELVHPGNFRDLPPSPKDIAYKAEFIGIAKPEEFFYWW